MVVKGHAARVTSKTPVPARHPKRQSSELAEEENPSKKVDISADRYSNVLAIQLVKFPKNPALGGCSDCKGQGS
jgi:hypothetical protein